jgi:hypothetical protein
MVAGPAETQGRQCVDRRIDGGNALLKRVDEVQRRDFAALQKNDDFHRALGNKRCVGCHTRPPDPSSLRVAMIPRITKTRKPRPLPTGGPPPNLSSHGGLANIEHHGDRAGAGSAGADQEDRRTEGLEWRPGGARAAAA